MAADKSFFFRIVPRFDDLLQVLLKKATAILATGIGVGGNDIIRDTQSHVGEWFVLHVFEDSVIGSVTFRAGSSSGTLAGATIKGGDRIFGIINEVTLTSGSAILYRTVV